MKRPRKICLTNKMVDRLTGANGKPTYIYDRKMPGLMLRITPTGTKSFVVYKRFGGQAVKKTLGQFPLMRIELARKTALSFMASRMDQKNSASSPALTYGEVFVQYLENYAKPHCRTWKEIIRINEQLCRRWQFKLLIDITKNDVQQWINELRETKGKYCANRTFSQFRAVINWAIRQDLVCLAKNPCLGIKRFHTEARERFIQPGEEWMQLKEAIEKYPNEDIRDCLWILAFTGARKSNVLAMRWEEINLDTAIWQVPMTKNGEPHAKALSQNALKILSKRIAIADSPWVFPSRGHTGHLRSIGKAWKVIVTNAGIKNLRIHDLRRTLASYMAINGASPFIIAQTLGHKDLRSTMIYARLNADPVRQALEKAQELMSASTTCGA